MPDLVRMWRKPINTALLLLGTALPVAAQDLDKVVTSSVIEGWRTADGTHMAAIHMRIAPGWKTYWRAPGDAGIPPRFVWQQADNVAGVSVEWPTPEVFWQQGTRSIGYHDEVILPLRVRTSDPARDVTISGEMHIGVCEEICLPYTVQFDSTLPASVSRRDPVITAALINRPFSGDEAGLRAATCAIAPVDGGVSVSASIDMPSAGGREEVVIEAADPFLWVSSPKSDRTGDVLSASAEILHVEGKSFALDRSGLRLTVIGQKYAVDILGCPAP